MSSVTGAGITSRVLKAIQRMRIAGLQKLSLVDYPGCIASTVFLQGCNFRCGYCHNPALIGPGDGSELDESYILDFINDRKNIIEAVVISGGEPTLHDGLVSFVRELKKTGLKIKLDTNGANPSVLNDILMEGTLDYIAMDIKTSFGKYHMVMDIDDIEKRIINSVCLTMLSLLPYEFRTTCVPGIVDENDIHEIGRTVKGAEKYCLQQFRPDSTYDGSFRNVTPYPPEKLRQFKSILEEYVKEVEIRGL